MENKTIRKKIQLPFLVKNSMDVSNILNSTTVRYVKFCVLVLFATFAAVCSLYYICNAIRVQSFRRKFHNQTLTILVFVVLADACLNIPLSLSYYVRGQAGINSTEFCQYWMCIDYIFTATVIWSQAIFTIERYMFVFHPHAHRSKRNRIIFHYTPLILLPFYLVLFYTFVTLFYTCDREVSYQQYLCGIQCLDDFGKLPEFNWVFNILLPVFIIIFGSVFLLVRVLWKRREMQRNLRNWSKNWRMVIQLMGIAIFYILVWIPLTVISILTTFKTRGALLNAIENQLYFASYLSDMIVPGIALLFSPELFYRCRRRRRIQQSRAHATSITIN